MKQLYPLKFKPILKERIWGGNKLASVLNKDSKSIFIGESWEISDVEGDTSIVANGHFKDVPLNKLLSELGALLIGEKNFKKFNTRFPLLIKFLDAEKNLSVQVHPNDKLAKKRHDSFGKTEMWYVMQADEKANLIIDFNQKIDKEQYLNHLNNKTLPEILNFEAIKPGDTYFIEAGRVHAIGAGVMLAEIQQTSDITYRIYDWDRVDSEGNSRPLHTDLAIDTIDFEMPNNYKVNYSTKDNVSNSMVSCPYFTTNYLEVTKKVDKQNTYDSFIVYLCIEGEATIETIAGLESIKKGETVLLPAAIKNYSLKAEKAKLLEVYV